MRKTLTLLATTLLLAAPCALAMTSAEAAERPANRGYHTLTTVKKVKVQACVGPVYETAVGPGMKLYVRLNNKRHASGASLRVTTNLLSTDYYAAARRNDSGRHAVVSPDENVRFKVAAYHKVADYEIVASSIGAC